MMYHPQTHIPLRSNLGVLQIGIKSQDTVMSDFEDSTVTYTTVSSPFGGLSDIGSPGVDGPPMMPEDPYAYVVAAFQAPPSPDYVSGPEYTPSPDFVPEPVYPEFMPPEDEVLPAEEQPILAAVLPTADSPGYVPESDSEEDREEDNDEDPKEDPADYPADGGDDGDDEDESSNDDEDDDVDIEGDEEEEEHPTPVDSTAVALPVVDHAPSAKETEPFETDEYAATLPPHPAYQLRAEALSTSHSPPPHIILSHTRADTPPSSTPPSRTPPLLPIPLPTSSPPLYEVGESSSAPTARPPRGFRADYGFVATMDREIMWDLERDVGRRMTEFSTRVRQDTDEIYVRLDDEQTERQLMAGRLNMLYRDRRAHACTALLMEREARMSREAWRRSIDASDLARSEVMALRTQVVAQQAVITELQAADRKRQVVITEMLAADHRRQAQFIEALKLLKRLHTQMTEFERQQGPAKGPTQPDAPKEAGSSS
ncbi:hypothetical protein Tco_0509280 [Tanacetum coccineum]